MANTQQNPSAQQAATNGVGALLLMLPPELRNQIYELVLEDAGDLKLRLMIGANAIAGEEKEPKKRTRRPPKLSFFMTCKQIRSETLTMVYSEFRLSVELPATPPNKAFKDGVVKALREDRDIEEQRTLHLDARKRQAKELESIVRKLFAVFPQEALRSIQHISFKDGESFRRFYGLDRELGKPRRYRQQDQGLLSSNFSAVKMITIKGYEKGYLESRPHVPLLSLHMHPLMCEELCSSFPALEKIRATDSRKTLQRYRVNEGRIYVGGSEQELESLAVILLRERQNR